MQDFIDDQNINALSPTMFIYGLEKPESAEHLKLEEVDGGYYDSQFDQQGKSSVDKGTKDSFKDQKKRLAGLKSREKKKKYVETLQEKVKLLSGEIDTFDFEISKCKDQLLEAIRTANHNSNQHAYTFTELQRNATSEDPDIDRINLLLDMIQNRIGANGKQRQANLDYNFKQIINSMFPAMHRYFMFSAVNSTDIFQEQVNREKLKAQKLQKWTHGIFREVDFQEEQIENIAKLKESFRSKRQASLGHISRLKKVKNQLKKQQEIFQHWMSDIRQDMTPIQSALITVFGQKNKLRRQFSLGEQFQDQLRPYKKLKIQE